MLLFHCLQDDLIADLALRRVAVAPNRVHYHLLIRELFVAVGALDIRNFFVHLHFLDAFVGNQIAALLTACASIDAATEAACAEPRWTRWA